MALYFQGNASSWYSSLSQMFESYQDLVKALNDQFINPASFGFGDSNYPLENKPRQSRR
jgi:hypothetical protein